MSIITLSRCLELFDDTLTTLRAGFAAIEGSVPKPKIRTRSGIVELRYESPSIELAMFLKLVRLISLLGGLRATVASGMVQEQGILQRAIDETDEDIVFLGFGHQNGLENLHIRFLEAFWAEEFQDLDKLLNHSRRHSVPRRAIEAYNAKQVGPSDPSTAQSINRLIQGVYSGYVHGASTHILDLYDVESRRFCVAGLGSTPVRESYISDSTNYPYRVLMSAVMVARRLGFGEVAEGFYLKLKSAERLVGLLTKEEADKLAARMRKGN